MGSVTAAGWLAAALGSAAASWVSRWVGVAAAAAITRVLQGLTVVGMGVCGGPVGVIVAFVACYMVHGASNPLHATLLHRQATDANRATVLSMNSMISQPAFSVGLIALTMVAGWTSVPVAMVVGAVVLAAAAPLYLPAWRSERLERLERAKVVGLDEC